MSRFRALSSRISAHVMTWLPLETPLNHRELERGSDEWQYDDGAHDLGLPPLLLDHAPAFGRDEP